MKGTSILFCLLMAFTTGFSQNQKHQAVFIYSFSRYIQWPDAYNQGDFEILVMGECSTLDALKAMASQKKVGDRSIKVTRINTPNEIRKCNILYVPAEKSAMMDDVIAKVNTQSILMVTDEPGMGLKGSDINFVTKDGKLTFELNQGALNRQNLKVSIELTRWGIVI